MAEDYEIKKEEELDGLYYRIPKVLFCKELDMYDILSIIFIQWFKSMDETSLFTISLLLKYYGIEEHHRKIKHIRDSLVYLSDIGLIELMSDVCSIDKNDMIMTKIITLVNNTSDNSNGYVTLQKLELDLILARAIEINNYNLLPIFLAIKSKTWTLNQNTNLFSSTQVSYSKITELSGVTSGIIIKECIDELCYIGVIKYNVIESGKKLNHEYSFKTVSELNKLKQST